MKHQIMKHWNNARLILNYEKVLHENSATLKSATLNNVPWKSTASKSATSNSGILNCCNTESATLT